MPLCRPRRENVGNTLDQDMLQGWTFPLPEDDRWSCDGTEDPMRGAQFEQISLFGAESDSPAALSQPVCRAAPGSTGGQTIATCAGIGHTRQLLLPTLQGHSLPTMTGTSHSMGLETTRHHFKCKQVTHYWKSTLLLAVAERPTHTRFCTHQRGRNRKHSEHYTATTTKQQPMQDYATSTVCILQNLIMAVGNPSARSNAPWRAFTWICTPPAGDQRPTMGYVARSSTGVT